MENAFCHMELTTGDPKKAREFYGKLFSWEFEEVTGGSGMPYIMIGTGREPGGGIMQAPAGVPVAWTTYVLVDKVADSLKKVPELGGKVLFPETEVPQYGKFGIIQDPTGGVIGLWEPFGEKK